MRRWMFLALAALLVSAWSRSSADFLVIKVDVNKNYLSSGQDPKNKPGPGVKQPGFQPGFQPGMQPQMQPGMQPGVQPGSKPPQGAGGFFPGQGLQQGGSANQGFPMNPNAGGTKPPYGNPKQPDTSGEGIQERWVYAYLELKTKPRVCCASAKGITHIEIDHAWGKRCVVPTELIYYIQKDSIGKDFEKRQKAEKKAGNDPARLYRLAEWALAHGLLKEFHATMDGLLKIESLPPTVKSALVAYTRVKAELKKTPSGDDPSLTTLIADLKSEGYSMTGSEHYGLLTNVPASQQDSLKRRLALMEDAYQKFFYWFALHSQDNIPPVPSRRLLGILVANSKEFQSKHAVWGSLPLVGDGFLPRRDNAMILCAEHLDDAYALLKKNNQDHVKTVSRDELLSGIIWKRHEAMQNMQNMCNTSYLQTMILVQKAIENAAERATISHEATRQLLFATGMLPRNVAVPEWIQYGLASFFETPHEAFYPGVGLPSWSNLIDFKYHRRKSHLGSPRDVLQQVVTDAFFQKARASADRFADSKTRSQNLARKVREDREVARATAWALVYYLARENKLAYLKNYSLELDRLPRDLELSDKILRSTFARAFELGDLARVQAFADSWFTEMENYVLEIPHYERDILQSRLEPPASDPKGSK